MSTPPKPDGRQPHGRPPGVPAGLSDADRRAVAGAKSLLRRAVRLSRDLRPENRRRSDDAARFAVLRPEIERRAPLTVAAYLSSGSEPGTLQLVAWWHAQGVRVLLPVLADPVLASPVLGDFGAGGPGRRREPAWAPYAGPDALRVGAGDILEPTTAVEPPDALASVQLVICPALAADAAGDRLGRGGGWYDRVLPQVPSNVPVVALLNDDEVLDAIATEPHDRPVHAIATPSRYLVCRPDRS